MLLPKSSTLKDAFNQAISAVTSLTSKSTSISRPLQASVVLLLLLILTVYLTATSRAAGYFPLLTSLKDSIHFSPPGPSSPLIELQGLGIGAPFSLPDVVTEDEDTALSAATGGGYTSSQEAYLDHIKSELLDRYSQFPGIDTSHPTCPLNLTRYTRSGLLHGSRTRKDATITIALNLYNSQDILPSLSMALLETIHALAPHHKIYLSIYENDSSDHTVPMLSELAAALVALNIDGVFIRHSYLIKDHGTERILGLAQLRNEALLPLLPYMGAGNSLLLFINDVITCSSDLLELAHQLLLQSAHAVFATDWDTNNDFPGTPRARFRDVWVTRGINGEMAYPWGRGYAPQSPNRNYVDDLFVTHGESNKRWKTGRPFPVYSGWNGAVALRASMFTELHVRFRASEPTGWSLGEGAGAVGKWGELISQEGYLESDCAASECKLFARDVWNLLDGKARFVLAPQARTAYWLQTWALIEDAVPPTRRTGEEEHEGEEGEDDTEDEELIDWSEVMVPVEVVCVPSYKDGKAIYPWDDDNVKYMSNPMFNASSSVRVDGER